MTETMTEAFSVLLLAIALGLDGFSVCIGLGLQNIRLKRLVFIGIAIGFFHIVFPLVGMIIGKVLSIKLTTVTEVISGALFIFLGSYMIFSSFSHPSERKRSFIYPKGFKLVSLASLVSIDSFPVGLSLGLSGMKTVIFISFFGVIAMFLSWLGLLIGKKTYAFLGPYSERCGGAMIFIFGFVYLFY